MQTNDIRFDLTIEETNLVLEALGQLPFVRVFGLIGKLQDVARAQIEGAAEPARFADGAAPLDGVTSAHVEASSA